MTAQLLDALGIILIASCKMRALIVDAVVAGASVHEDSADMGAFAPASALSHVEVGRRGPLHASIPRRCD